MIMASYVIDPPFPNRQENIAEYIKDEEECEDPVGVLTNGEFGNGTCDNEDLNLENRPEIFTNNGYFLDNEIYFFNNEKEEYKYFSNCVNSRFPNAAPIEISSDSDTEVSEFVVNEQKYLLITSPQLIPLSELPEFEYVNENIPPKVLTTRKLSKNRDGKRKHFPNKTNFKSTKQLDECIARFLPNLKCVICNWTSTNFTTVRSHFVNVHTGEKFYILCCQQKFATRPKFLLHLQSKHGNGSEHEDRQMA